jgi:hypothetical protein
MSTVLAGSVSIIGPTSGILFSVLNKIISIESQYNAVVYAEIFVDK